jgi:hypothetical protein
MTRQFFNRTVLFLFAIVLVHLLIAGGASAQEIGVKVIAKFHDEIVNSWPSNGTNKFKTQTTAILITRLGKMFRSEKFAPADEESELVLEIDIDPGYVVADVADYAFTITVMRVQKGGKPVTEYSHYMEPDWHKEYPSSPEEASVSVAKSINRLFSRESADVRKALDAIKGRRLPIAIKIMNLDNPGNLLNQDVLVIEPVRPFVRPAYTRPIDNGKFPDSVELPRVGRSYQANLRLEPRTGNNNANSGTITELCLRAAAVLIGNEILVEMRCSFGGNCALKDPQDVQQWVRECDPRTDWRWPRLIGTAQARSGDTNKRIWYAPSLRTLHERRRSGHIRGVGYTVFTLRADKLADLKADAFTYQVSVNGTPVHFSGVPSKATVQSLDPEFGFELQFGLENHYFRGDQLGCDVIGVELNFLKNNEPVGRPIQLTRPYIALRDASRYQNPNWPYPFRWSGRYKMPRENWEYELFVSGDKFYWVPPASRADLPVADLNKARRSQQDLEKRMQWNRDWIDKKNIPGPDSTRLVGVLRPPLSIDPGAGVMKKLAYGIALGLEDLASGQVFFTFTESQRDAHKAFFKRKFAELKGYNGSDPATRKLKKAIGNFEEWLGPPSQWEKYQIGSNDDPTPPGFCEKVPSD